MDDEIMNTSTNETAAEIIRKKPLVIFKTEADITGRDITKMSNFFDGYVQQMSLALREQDGLELISELPVANLNIINEVVQRADVLMKGSTTLVPDFDSLPTNIKSKLKKNIYSIGESKQVDGNMRAVILDENGVRIKDITLKKVVTNPGNLEAVRSLGNQLQMKQIYAKLASIEEFQTYQLERDRDNTIIVPFLDARSLVLQAGNTSDPLEQKQLLLSANAKVTSAIHSVYTDLDTTARNLAKKTRNPFIDIGGRMNNYMHYMTSDLQIATKYVGVSMQILEYIGDSKSAQNVLLEYQQTVYDFLTKPLTKKGLSAVNIMHDYFPYNDDNRNCWKTFAEETTTVLENGMKKASLKLSNTDTANIYIVSLEDVNDAEK